MIVSVMHNEQHQILMRLLLLRKTRRLPRHTTISRAQTRVDSFDGLRKPLTDQMLIRGQHRLERSPIIRAIPHHLQVLNQAIEPSDGLRVAATPDIGQDFIGLRRIGVEKPAFVLFAFTDKRPELIEYDPIILFLHGIDHELVGLSSQAACDGLCAHAQHISTVAEAAAASEHVQGLSLTSRIGTLVEVLVLELLAAAAAEQVLGPGRLFAVFDYFVGEAVGAVDFGGYFAHIPKVAPAASHHTFY